MKLILLLFASAPLFAMAGEIPGGTYTLKGVFKSEWRNWTCVGTSWKHKSYETQTVPQTRDIVIRDMGWAITSSYGGILKPHTDQQGCSYLVAVDEPKAHRHSSLIPFQNGFPSTCQADKNRILTVSFREFKAQPLGPCSPHQTFKSGNFDFLYGYEVDAKGVLVWNPQPIEYKAP